MINFVRSLVPGCVKVAVVIVAICGVGGNMLFMSHQLKTKDEMLSNANAKIVKLTEEYRIMNDTLKQSIAMQNESISRYQQDSDEAKDKLDASIKVAAKQKASYDKQIMALLNQPRPANCQDSIDSMVNAVEKLQWDK